MPKPPSLQDVANAAGLSPATVSRYLNGSLNLPPATAERIDRAIAALDYKPNPHARRLSRGKSDTIGLVIPEIDNPFFAKLAAAAEREAEAAGLALMLFSSLNRRERELDYLEKLRRNFVDGLIFATNSRASEDLASVINDLKNVVVIDEDIDGVTAPRVFSDNDTGGVLAARCFIENGHTRFAFIGGPEDIMSTRERLAGFRRVIDGAKSGATLNASYFGSYSVEFGRTATARLLDEHPDVTALFVGADEILFGALETMRGRGMTAGRELSVITFDDAGPLAFFDPPITAVRQPIEEIGRTAVNVLRRLIEGSEVEPVTHLPVELVVRRSVRRLS
ncbi:LacI family DNA-binding transcriptional regulator [Rhizobium sp. C4]|uniref:LacI family DNA-binding transcriptional regulator n=1 Tax=Rhizobium sp. C4 TaxID=1349800 RepID=UPI001E48EB16|nr:LacI family DNA-binding transcriptional regulator [Rhizobium sp. C4]MCD2172568.1 LacI family transcriptional regulator [Rhizobium sp. C4]